LQGTVGLIAIGTILGLAPLVGLAGLWLQRLAKVEENNSMSALGMGVLFLCLMGVLGLWLIHVHPLAHIRPPPRPAEISRP